EHVEPPDDAAEPAARPPIDLGPAGARYRIADRHDVRVREEDVDVAVGMRAVPEMSAEHALVADRQLGLVVEGLVRPTDLRKRLDRLLVPRPRDVGREPKAGIHVGDDPRPGPA